MPTLQIIVVDPPTQFPPYTRLELLLADKDGQTYPPVIEGGDLRFDLPIEIRPDKAGDMQGWGPAVVRQNDGRRFVYLNWIGHQNGMSRCFRRLKVFLDRVSGFPGESDSYTVRVQGQDRKGGPACATAVVV